MPVCDKDHNWKCKSGRSDFWSCDMDHKPTNQIRRIVFSKEGRTWLRTTSWANDTDADAKQGASAHQTEWGTLRAHRGSGTFHPQLKNLLALRVVDCLFSFASYFSNVRTYWITALI